jgi:cellulose synthase/poly-beta-1,6-N-acetylglucosamine synthase-like glycosyltransferase
VNALTYTLALSPLGIIGTIRWTSWCFRRLVAMLYRPVLPGFTAPMTLVVPVYQEDPEIFVTAIESWLRNPVDEVLCVVDITDEKSMQIARDFERTGRVRMIPTSVPGKRDALAKGWREATTPLVALVDSDTIWDDAVAAWVMAPFADPAIGGVGTRQNVWKPKGMWQNAADMYLDYRYYDEIAAQSVAGQAVSCLSGRTAVYRRELLLTYEEAFLNETFLGTQCMSGDDKRLTTLLLEHGHKTFLQREARVWSTFPDTFPRFVKQRVRWARNTWRSDIRAMFSGWIWQYKFLAFTTIDKAISSFTLLLAPTFLLIALFHQSWRLADILIVWWLVSRGFKLLPHFRRRPGDIWRLPFYILTSICMALIKIYALGTIRQHKWLTRDVAVVDGIVQRTHGVTPDMA